MTNFDTSKVPDYEKRIEAKRLYDASVVAREAYENAVADAPIPDEVHRKISGMWQDHHMSVRRQRDEVQEAADALIDSAYNGGEIGALSAALRDAAGAYEDYDSPAIMTDEDDDPVICALSGAPVFDDDEIIEDPSTGEIVLRCLVLPPRSEVDGGE